MKLIVIGSNSNAHIRFNSQYVSGYHAEILLLDNGEILLTDKGSMNGTFINDQRIQPNKEVSIRRGDNIRFADCTLNWNNVPANTIPDPSKIKEMRGVGSNFRNKYQIQGDRVSRFHATLIKKNDGKWYFRDHSKNGTTINGRTIPSNQDIKLKRGDKILCAGVYAPNPCDEEGQINIRAIITALVAILVVCGGACGIAELIKKDKKDPKIEEPTPDPIGNRIMTDTEIYKYYENSVVFVVGRFYYKVTAGPRYTEVLENLEKNGLFTTEYVVTEYGSIVPRINEYQYIEYSGTGFYISEDGKIATNLHIVEPWKEEIMNDIRVESELTLKDIAEKYSESFDVVLSHIKVEGILEGIYIIPNKAYFSPETIRRCRVYASSDNIEKDIAIIALDTQKLPDEDCVVVDLTKAATNNDEICVGSHIYTMGYPFGAGLQDLRTKVLELYAQDGKITRAGDMYSFGFNAASYHGASGSPIFNEKGQLIGILAGGVDISQGFNTAIKARHLVDLAD